MSEIILKRDRLSFQLVYRVSLLEKRGNPTPAQSQTVSMGTVPNRLHGHSPKPSPWAKSQTVSMGKVPTRLHGHSPNPSPWAQSQTVSMGTVPHRLHPLPPRLHHPQTK